MIEHKTFKLIAPIKKSEQIPEETSTENFFIEGIANSGLEDLVGDVVTNEALQSIVDQAPQRNLHLDHNEGKENILGRIVESELLPEGAWIKASIVKEQRDWLKSYLEQGIIYGLSISGTCDYESGSNSQIVDWQLTEISLTDTPCDPATMGTVSMSKSFDKILFELKKDKTEEVMEANNMAEENYITVEDATKLVNDAFNERKEEFLETIRDEVKNEYEAGLNELKERLDTLESKLEEGKPEEEKTEEEKPEEEKPEEEKPEEEKGLTETQIKSIVENKIKNIFNDASKDIGFKYNEHKNNKGNETKKDYTAEELTEMGVI